MSDKVITEAIDTTAVFTESSATNDLIITEKDIFQAVFGAYGTDATEEAKIKFKIVFSQYLKQIVNGHECSKDYNVVILHDPTILVRSDADKIYGALKSLPKNGKPLLMILHSSGGDGSSAYLIGKLCREFSNNRFLVSIPRNAKSAATLLACAADGIHMGSLSELGPIDPQINGMPALGLKNAIEHIAELVKSTPQASGMFAQYLKDALKIIDLGYYERVAESAVQYAERLLSTHSDLLTQKPLSIAYKLVYQYKDHGFAIDKNEAIEIFGEKVIRTNTPEYELGNSVYSAMSQVEELTTLLKHSFYFIGTLNAEPVIHKK